MVRTTVLGSLCLTLACQLDPAPGVGSGASATDGDAGSDAPAPSTSTDSTGPIAMEDSDATGLGETGDTGDSGAPALDVGPPATTTDGEPVVVDCDNVVDLDSNVGCVFWAVDLPNSTHSGGAGPPAADQPFAVAVSNAATEGIAHVTASLGDGATVLDSADIAPGELYIFALPSQNIEPHAGTDDGVAYRIESDLPVTAYQFNPLDNVQGMYSSDASLLLPEHTLQADYTAVTSEAANVVDGDGGAFVSVVATQDGTIVDLFPTSPLLPGPVTDVALDRGQVLTIVSVPPGIGSGASSTVGSLAGTRVSASAPVAVFAGNVCGKDPAWLGYGACDHLEHQMLPLTSWGTAYALAPTPSRLDDFVGEATVYRITGAFDDTQLVYSPAPPAGAPAQLGAYETVGFMTDAAFTVTSTDADKPFAVTHFVVGTGAIPDDDNMGDPAMLVVPAVQQLQARYVFLVPDGYARNYVTVVGREGTTVTLDGQASVLGDSVGTLDGSAWASSYIAADPGPHVLDADDGVLVTVIGFDTFISYGYPAGSGTLGIARTPPEPAG